MAAKDCDDISDPFPPEADRSDQDDQRRILPSELAERFQLLTSHLSANIHFSYLLFNCNIVQEVQKISEIAPADQ